jgi:hypothetical protein
VKNNCNKLGLPSHWFLQKVKGNENEKKKSFEKKAGIATLFDSADRHTGLRFVDIGRNWLTDAAGCHPKW